MIEIARHDGAAPVDLNEISRNQGISKKYLHTLMVALKNGGVLRSVRGNTGGYLLARKPGDINLFELYTILEGTLDLVDCVSEETSCRRSGHCTTQRLWRRLGTILQNELETTTLASLVSDDIRDDNEQTE